MEKMKTVETSREVAARGRRAAAAARKAHQSSASTNDDPNAPPPPELVKAMAAAAAAIKPKEKQFSLLRIKHHNMLHAPGAVRSYGSSDSYSTATVRSSSGLSVFYPRRSHHAEVFAFFRVKLSTSVSRQPLSAAARHQSYSPAKLQSSCDALSKLTALSNDSTAQQC